MTFGILRFFQKMNERIPFLGLTVLKTNLFIHFLEEPEDTKKPFEIIWPLVILLQLYFSLNAQPEI